VEVEAEKDIRVENVRTLQLLFRNTHQEHLLAIQNWLQKWKIKVNETKSSHITFTLRKALQYASIKQSYHR
jgi:hypothetical protein